MATSAGNMVADIGVTIDGAELPPAAYRDLIEVRVVEEIGVPTMFSLRIATWDQDTLAFSWVDSDLYAIGNAVVLRFGYVDELTTVMSGEITSLELEVAAGEPPILVVRGYDRLHRLLRGQKTRSFVQMKDSDIAAQIAGDAGLVPEVTDSGVALEYVLQHAQADLDFLRQRAEAIGYEISVDGTTFHYRPHQNAAKSTITLSADDDVIDFHARMTARGQAGEVDVRGWDPQRKQAIVGRATTRSSSMGATPGAAVADAAFGAAVVAWVDHPVFSQQEADQLAAGRLGNLSLGYVQGEGTCAGRADLRVGTVAMVEGLGQRFSGPYYITAATHAYSATQGYRTRFTVRRDAS